MTAHAKFKGLGQLFSYLATKDKIVQKKAKVPDFSCSASNCHPQNDEFLNKQVKFTEKISYVHKSHFEKQIEGQTLHCDTCHQHVSPDKHFEVPKTVCYLCHFKNSALNEGKAKCATCHAIPDKPLKKLEEGAEPPAKIITHKSIEDAKVSCQSCHYQIVQGKGEIKKEGCFNCHDYSAEMLKKAEDKKLMHESHVASQEAHCFECHMPIAHKEVPHFEAALENCKNCHPEPHINQQLLIAGAGGKGLDRTYPIAHFDVKINCLACHTKDGFDDEGRKVKRAEVRACVECHIKDEEKRNLPAQWKASIIAEIENAKDIEKSAIDAVEAAKGKAPAKTIRKVTAMIKDGHENLKIVEAGGGVHNKKYATLLLDIAVEKFEMVLEELGVEQ